jgi:CO/xanthine dehydrogenase Mo-binding subunit
VGEPPIVPGAAAVANAIQAACGARVTQVPMVPERVIQALDRTSAATPGQRAEA